MTDPNGDIWAYLKPEDEAERSVTFRGTRDPQMSQTERKMIRCMGYLGLTVYQDMKKDREWLKESLTDMMERPEFRFGGELRPQVMRLTAILESLDQKLKEFWLFLYGLAVNFENLDPMGTNFIRELQEAYVEERDEESPIAIISLAGVEDPD